jgi:tRNA nucleotidyltransferase/poly(A) polymerase
LNLNHFFFEACAQVAAKYQIKTYVVGGWVRDQLLNRPSKDIDIVVEGNGMDFAQKVAQEIDTNIQVNFFKTFGTAQFNYKDYDYEFVGARKESYDHNSRKPVVENGTIQEDIARRDFTINALAISLNEADYGQIIDFHQGKDRAVGFLIGQIMKKTGGKVNPTLTNEILIRLLNTKK